MSFCFCHRIHQAVYTIFIGENLITEVKYRMRGITHSIIKEVVAEQALKSTQNWHELTKISCNVTEDINLTTCKGN